MTTAENERLAIVENEVKNLNANFTDLKVTIVGFDNKLDGVLLYIAGEKGGKAERRRESQAAKWALSVGIPAAISIIGLLVGKLT